MTGIGEPSAEDLEPELGGWLHGYERVGSVCDEQEMLATVRRLQDREWVDRLEATVEAHVLPVARVREAAGIPGTSARVRRFC